MTQRTFVRMQVVMTLGIALLVALPFFLYTLRPDYHGLVPIRVSDDGMYYGHLQSALLGRYSEVTNGITAPPVRGAGPAFLELVAGFLFSWTDLHGPQVSLFFTVLIAPLILPLLIALLRSMGISRAVSLMATLVYTFVFLSPLQRPVHMSWSLPLSILVLLLLSQAWKTQRPLTVMLAGTALAVFPAIYFWSWTYLWAVGGSLLLVHLLFTDAGLEKKKRTIALLTAGAIALALSAPYFMQLWELKAAHPSFAEVALRSNVVSSRWVESLPRSILLTVLAASSLLLVWRGSERKSGLLPLALVLAAFAVMHQNLVHGTDFMFSSHYYPYVCLAATVMAAWALNQSTAEPELRSVHGRELGCAPHRRCSVWCWGSGQAFEHRFQHIFQYSIMGIAATFLLAGAWDYKMAWTLPFASPAHLTMQHLAPALKLLEDGTRETVLSDFSSSQMVTSWTDDDVVFTPYVRHLLVSNGEFAERYCLSELANPVGPDFHWIAWEATQVQSAHLYSERREEFQRLCTTLFADPRAALRKYGVDLLLWNHRERPTWKVPSELFEKVGEGEDWSLYRLTSSQQ